MPRKKLPKVTFEAGELSPEFYRREDTQQYQLGAKALKNTRLLDAGAATRRPGSWRIAVPAVDGIIVPFYFNQEQIYVLVFSNTRMDAYLEDGTAAGNLTSAPWTTAMLPDLRWYQEKDTVFLYHRDLPTQVIKRTGASTWSRAAYAFDAQGDSVVQPYFKFEPAATTLQPGAVSGTGVTLTASPGFFVAGHVGTRFRYLGREMEVTAVTNATTATVTIREKLPAAQTLTVEDSGLFQVGQIVEHDIDSVKGIVTAIPTGTTITVIPSEGIQAFQPSNNLVGPDGSSAITGTASATLPALTNWDEQVFSSVRGYPGVGTIHRNRKVFADHPIIPGYVMMSKIGQYYNFDLGSAADADAIFEPVGDGSVEKVTDLVSAESLLLTTSAGSYYIAERIGQPFTPTNFIPRRIDTYSAGTGARAGLFAENIYFPHANGKAIIELSPTGDIERPWGSRNIALTSPHLIKTPVSTGFAEEFQSEPERYGFFVNNDGTLAVLHAITDASKLGFVPWETDGEYKSIGCVGNRVFALVERTIYSSTVYWLEVFDVDVRLDGAVEFTNATDTISGFNNETVRVTADNYDFGDVTVGAAGAISVDTEYDGPFEAGIFYSPTIEPMTPAFVGQDVNEAAAEIKRIVAIYSHVLNTGRYFVNGVPNTSYRGGDDFSAAPPLRTEIRKSRTLGRTREPTAIITQEQAVPLTVTGITHEVIY